MCTLGQPSSSLPSLQSLCPSHLKVRGKHLPSAAQVSWSLPQVFWGDQDQWCVQKKSLYSLRILNINVTFICSCLYDFHSFFIIKNYNFYNKVNNTSSRKLIFNFREKKTKHDPSIHSSYAFSLLLTLLGRATGPFQRYCHILSKEGKNAAYSILTSSQES